MRGFERFSWYFVLIAPGIITPSIGELQTLLLEAITRQLFSSRQTVDLESVSLEKLTTVLLRFNVPFSVLSITSSHFSQAIFEVASSLPTDLINGFHGQSMKS